MIYHQQAILLSDSMVLNKRRVIMNRDCVCITAHGLLSVVETPAVVICEGVQ